MVKKDIIGDVLFKVYLGIICFFYSIIFAGSVLGVAGLYKPVYVFPLVFMSTLLLFKDGQEPRPSVHKAYYG